MNDHLDHASGLLKRARNDLIAADAIVATGQALDTVCFHAQQAAEKSLKALLALENVQYPRRHDLGELLALAPDRDGKLQAVAADLFALAPFAVAVRYDEGIEPSIDEARSALVTARQVYQIALDAVDDRADRVAE